MILDKPDTSSTINHSQFGKKLLNIILLLIGFGVLNAILIFIIPEIPLEDTLRDFLMSNSRWIASLAFGFAIFAIIKNTHVGIPVAILSVVMPWFGAIFYLITISITED
jgi:hypothetical protein